MTESRHLADDPRLTAYALGELDAAERTAIEAQLQASPALRDAVNEIRATAAALERALASEAEAAAVPTPAAAAPVRAIDGQDVARAAILPGRDPQVLDGGDYRRPRRRRAKVFAFPQLYYIAGGLCAAGLAVIVALQRDSINAREAARARSLRVAMERRAEARTAQSVIVQLPLLAGDETPAGGMAAEVERMGAAAPATGSNAYQRENAFLDARQHPLSTFPVKVNTASYANVKRLIEESRRPPPAAVRVEELVNYFSYNYPAPGAADGTEPGAPVAASLEVAEAPWAPGHRLARIGLKGRDKAVVDPLGTIAKGVKVQVEFNPARVARYRLIGNESRDPTKKALNDGDADAAEIGAGHAVTALYEIVPVEGKREAAAGTRVGGEIAELRYGSESGAAGVSADVGGELLTVKLRYTDPAGGASRRMEFPLVDRGGKFAQASADFRFAAAVAGFGMILRSSPHHGSATLRDVLTWPAEAIGGSDDDPDGQRGEFLDLVRKMQLLME